MSTLSTFKTKVTSDKLAQQHYYKVSLFKVPNGVGSKNNDSNQFQNNDTFDIWCQAAKMPGQTLTELELKKHNFLFRMPDHVEFDGTCYSVYKDWRTDPDGFGYGVHLDTFRTLEDAENYFEKVKRDIKESLLKESKNKVFSDAQDGEFDGIVNELANLDKNISSKIDRT